MRNEEYIKGRKVGYRIGKLEAVQEILLNLEKLITDDSLRMQHKRSYEFMQGYIAGLLELENFYTEQEDNLYNGN